MLQRRWLSLLGLVLLGVGGWYGYRVWWAGTATARVVEYKTVPVKIGVIERTVTTDGRVEALLVVDVKSKASGTVANVLVNESDAVEGPDLEVASMSELFDLPLYYVRPGQLLVQLDPIDEQRNVDRTEALLKAELARLARSEAELARITETVEADYLTALAEKEAAAAGVASAESSATAVLAQRDAAASDVSAAQVSLADAQDKFERQERLMADRLTSREEYITARNSVARLTAALAQAQANLRVLESRILQARQDVLRAKAQLAQADARIAVSRAGRRQVQVQQQEVALMRANVSVAQTTLADARRRLIETDIVAPIDGVVLKKWVDRGQVITSGTQNVGGGTTLLTVADVSRLFVLASVPEADIELVRNPTEGRRQPVRITADALGSKKLEGEVVYRVPQATTENNVTTVKVRIEVTDRQKARLLPGETCNVEILADRRENVLIVPASAVFRGESPESRLVYTLDELGKPVATPVKVGLSTPTSVEIVSGLSVGQLVVASAAAVGDTVKGSEKKPGGTGGFRPPRF